MPDGSGVATISLEYEGHSEAEAREHAERPAPFLDCVYHVVKSADLEVVYQAIFTAHPSVQRIYATRWGWACRLKPATREGARP